jgi:two-component system sensor histidine kinase UhpB
MSIEQTLPPDILEDLRECAEAARQERSRIRRELHDGIGQTVTALLFGLAWLDRFRHLFPDRYSNLNEIAGALKRQTSRLVKSLDPTELERWGMLAILTPKIESWAQSHAFHFHSTGPGAVQLDAGPEIVLYRLIRASLLRSISEPRTNRIDLALERRSDHFLAVVEDDAGDPGDSARQEILQLARDLSTEADVEPGPAGGTILTFRIPF